jgi:hypothetical protein
MTPANPSDKPGKRQTGRSEPTRTILLLAVIAVLAQALDLLSAVRMISTYGLHYELNPVARAIFVEWGPSGLTLIKLAAVAAGVLLVIQVARRGRLSLASSSLALVAIVGMFGFYTNLV